MVSEGDTGEGAAAALARLRPPMRDPDAFARLARLVPPLRGAWPPDGDEAALGETAPGDDAGASGQAFIGPALPDSATIARETPPSRAIAAQRSRALARLLPPIRPGSITADAAPPQAAGSAADEDDTVAYLAPLARPDRLAARAAEIRAARKAAAEKVARRQEPARTTPREQLNIPGSARVRSTATIEDGIVLGDIALIGIFGKKSARRALIRLPQGRIVQVERGTAGLRLDGLCDLR